MKTPKIDPTKENALTTSEFSEHLKAYQEDYAQDIPVILLIAEAKEIKESDGETEDRKISMPRYGNTQMSAFYFYKSISTILTDDD